jgi:hypothetical protein
MLSQAIPHEVSVPHFWHIVIFCLFLKVSGLGHFKAKGKPLRNVVGENTRSFRSVTQFFYTYRSKMRWISFRKPK